MSNLTKEYLDDMIKKRVFKDFDTWNKHDFHFLLTLFNYPNYFDLALIILTNLKNWILYSGGNFFYSIEKVDNILEKFKINQYNFNDIFNEKRQEFNNNINISF